MPPPSLTQNWKPGRKLSRRERLRRKIRFAPRPLWEKAHPQFTTRARPSSPPPDATRLLRAQNEYFCAGAVWERRGGLWYCTHAPPILAWMKRLDPASAKIELLKRGCSFQWLNPATGQPFS